MKPIPNGNTWREIQDLFDADNEFKMYINRSPRRIRPGDRKKKINQDVKKVVRLLVQRTRKHKTSTLFRKNLKELDENFLDEIANEKVVRTINFIITD